MNETEKLRKRTSTKYERAKAKTFHRPVNPRRRCGHVAPLWARPGTHMRRPRHSRLGRVPAQMWASLPSPNPEGSVSNAAGPCHPVVRYATVATVAPVAPACTCEPSERYAQPQSAQATHTFPQRYNGTAARITTRRHESRRGVCCAARLRVVCRMNAPQRSRLL